MNTLLSCDYTVIFIGHAQEKDGKMFPKGDKRSVDPVRDFVDYVIYVESNGVDEDGKVIPSSAYLAETDRYFARSRFDTTPTYLPVWSAEALEEAVNIGIKGLEEKKAEIDNITDKSEQSTENNKITILALGLPYFEITSDGNLELEEGLISNWINKFSINENGELIYTDDDTNRFTINDDGELIYTR